MKDVPQHKRMAMGEKVSGMKAGGAVRKTGMAMNPVEKAKRANGVPGMKMGGKVKKGC